MSEITSDYLAADGYVFVAASGEIDWELMTIVEAVDGQRAIIGCGYCVSPALRLDHYWPYGRAGNLCAEHDTLPREGNDD